MLCVFFRTVVYCLWSSKCLLVPRKLFCLLECCLKILVKTAFVITRVTSPMKCDLCVYSITALRINCWDSNDHFNVTSTRMYKNRQWTKINRIIITNLLILCGHCVAATRYCVFIFIWTSRERYNDAFSLCLFWMGMVVRSRLDPDWQVAPVPLIAQQIGGVFSSWIVFSEHQTRIRRLWRDAIVGWCAVFIVFASGLFSVY